MAVSASNSRTSSTSAAFTSPRILLIQVTVSAVVLTAFAVGALTSNVDRWFVVTHLLSVAALFAAAPRGTAARTLQRLLRPATRLLDHGCDPLRDPEAAVAVLGRILWAEEFNTPEDGYAAAAAAADRAGVRLVATA